MDIATINSKISELSKSEKITKQLLTELSRELLAYVYNTGDVTPVNRTLRALTPMNKATSILYFKHFLAWSFKEDFSEFSKKNKKAFESKQELVEIFLLDETNNIFTWATDNVKIEKAPVDWSARLRKDIAKALEGGLSAQDVISILNEVLEDEEVLEAA